MESISRREFIKKSAIAGTVLGVNCSSGLCNNIEVCDKEFDIVIKGGKVFDGTGKEGAICDVAIKGDRIVKVERDIASSAGKRVIDASGLVVCPGFVDIHTHSTGGDMSYCYIQQGVTTEIGGNCGSTPSPRKIKNGKYTIGQDLDAYEGREKLTNFGILVGHAAIRNFGVGLADRVARDDEIKVMQNAVAESLEEGVFGLSSGLEYAPGCFSDEREMIELCKVVKKYDGIYTTHMRNEQEGVYDAVLETIRVARASDVRLEISHLKMSRAKAWPLADKVLKAIIEAKQSGLDIACDKYPYSAWSTALSILFPKWAKDGDSALLGQNSNLLRRLKDKSLDARLRKDVEAAVESMSGPENIVIDGKSLKEICRQTGLGHYDAMREIILKTNAGAGVIGFSMNEENIEKLLAFDLTMLASDGHGQRLDVRSTSHPRSFGTSARFLGRYVREKKIMPLSTAIRKMTSQPAEHFRIKDRGVLAKGKFADVTIFDYENIIDNATFELPNQKSNGIEYVVVNGKLALEKGELTGTKAGLVLRKS